MYIVDHKDIVSAVRTQYAAYVATATGGGGATAPASTSPSVSVESRRLAQEVLQRIGPIQSDIWREYLWPQIQRKVLATLNAANREVVHRERTFEFLGNIVYCILLTVLIFLHPYNYYPRLRCVDH